MIDLTNYETWFLLYADNELSAEEKNAVLSFVKQHPFLQQELDEMLKLRFSPADQQYQLDKSSLYSGSIENKMQAELHEHNLLLNYIDGELSAKDMIEVESRIDQDAALFTSYKHLSSLKLEPDQSIVYPNKTDLYRHQKTVSIAWEKSLAVAASLIIAAGLFWIFNQSNDNNNDQVVVVKPKAETIKSIQPAPVTDSNSFVYNSNIDRQAKNSKASVRSVKIKDAAIKIDEEKEQVTADLDITSTEVEVISTDAIQDDIKVVSNNLPVPNAIAGNNAEANFAASQDLVFIDNDENSKKAAKKPFKGLTRKISRILGKERVESDQVKFIQVANFQFAVSKQ
jgi:hypothetical protein